MKLINRKKMLWVMAAILVIANLSVDINYYSLQVQGHDPSAQGFATYVYFATTGETLALREGESITIEDKSSGVVSRKGEIGWLQIPVKAKRHVRISLRKEATIVCLAAIQQVRGQKKNDWDSLKLLTGEIPVIFEDKFPVGYKNDVKYWGNIPKEDLHSCLHDGTAKLLTMDLDIGDKCSLNCPTCFRRDKRFDVVKNPLTHEQIVGYVREAKGLGLKQIKILGRGEPFENPRFLGFLREMTDLDVGVAIFTKGHVLGSDALAERYNKENYGITTGWEIIQQLKDLKVSILLGFNSFNRRMQEEFTGIDKYPDSSPLKNYVEFRDKALMNLVKAGFNDYEEEETTRLAMISAPIKPENIHEIFDMYVWARQRNIYMLSCPTTDSGKGIDLIEELKRKGEFKDYLYRLEDLWVQIYGWAIKTNLIPIDVFREDEVSLYPGCHVCNQTAAGFYLNLSGQVNMCPGRVDESTVFSSDVRKDGLKKVWEGCSNCKRAKYGKQYNYHCLARGFLPPDFYRNIKARALMGL